MPGWRNGCASHQSQEFTAKDLLSKIFNHIALCPEFSPFPTCIFFPSLSILNSSLYLYLTSTSLCSYCFNYDNPLITQVHTVSTSVDLQYYFWSPLHGSGLQITSSRVQGERGVEKWQLLEDRPHFCPTGVDKHRQGIWGLNPKKGKWVCPSSYRWSPDSKK